MSPDACCAHDHDCDASTCGNASLHAFVDVPAVTAFNAREDDAAPGVIRAWERRHDRTGRALVSEDDGELVIRIPFTTDVKLRGVMVLGGAGRASAARDAGVRESTGHRRDEREQEDADAEMGFDRR